MIKRFLGFLFLLTTISSCISDMPKSGLLSDGDATRIVLVGGTLISSMEDSPYLETALTYHYVDKEFSLRNIGWPADDVFGMARSQFGSAQNSRSWQVPNLEEGFGSQVLKEHIAESGPETLVIGYGPETAFYNSDEEFNLFESGYERLLNYADSSASKIILLTPPKQELTGHNIDINKKRNTNLGRTSDYIKKVGDERSLSVIDLNSELVIDPSKQTYTTNGVHLSDRGYEKMSQVIMQVLEISQLSSFALQLDENVNIIKEVDCTTEDWNKTVNGVKFTLEPAHLSPTGKVSADVPVAIYVNGNLQEKTLDSVNVIKLGSDLKQHKRLVQTIREKNRLYRYRLRPLNEAYIYLFRKHEMGHLAYEMDDLLKLVGEKEEEIKQMMRSSTYFVEVEVIKPWIAPKTYADDEVPNFIPEPNIEEELAAFNIADGYEVSLFAQDPMIANPINVNWDTRGRAWVGTSSTYPHIVPGREPNDKIIILEDTNGDGKADKHTVFAENLLVPHSVMPVKGGAFVTATTQLLFLEDTDGDDVADKTHVILDGFGNADVHHTIHGLRWTPWGDLHFTQGIYINSFVETGEGQKVLNGSGTWSFRPENRRLEVFSRGLINPWGEALDEWGQAFATDGAGSSGVSYIFPESAHRTAVGTRRVLVHALQETPKHTAAEVIYSAHFPRDWQGTAITNDFRANRTVRYELDRMDSGYKSKEVETILSSDHRSYRPVDSKIGPDGALFVVDWYNPIVDHGEVDFHHPVRDKTHGRIWRFSAKGKAALKYQNLEKANVNEIFEKLRSTEQLTRLRANRALVEKEVDPALVSSWIRKLSRSSARYEQSFFEGLWLLAALNAYDEALLSTALSSNDYHVRAAAVRLVSHYDKQSTFLAALERAILDTDGMVRLEALHALREMGGKQAADIASRVMKKPMDDNIDFALTTTLAKLQPAWILEVNNGKGLFNDDPNVLMYALLTSEKADNLTLINDLVENDRVEEDLRKRAWHLLAKIGDEKSKSRVLAEAAENQDLGLFRSLARAPAKFSEVPTDLEPLKGLILQDSTDFQLVGCQLAGRWKVSDLQSELLDLAQGTDEQNVRLEALRSLIKMEEKDAVIGVASSGKSDEIRAAATSVWLENDAEAGTAVAAKLLASIKDEESAELLIRTFIRQEGGPSILEDKLKGMQLSEEVASAGLRVVQTSGLNLATLEKQIRASGSITAIGAELTSEEKSHLIAEAEDNADIGRGKKIYRRKEMMCGSCHQVDKEGGLSGPYLGKIGTFMSPAAILESLLNPSSTIKQNYETVIVTRTDGEVINGILHRKTADATLIRQTNGQVVEIPSTEIGSTDVSPNSLMPPGLTRNLSKDELKDLVGYLMSLGV